MKILYLCPDLGVPVLGRKGASVHVRELVAALGRAGHNVVLAAQLLNKSPWEKPATLEATLLQVRANPSFSAAILALKEFNEMIGGQSSLAGELRRILFNKELAAELKGRFDSAPPDFIYERASLYGTAGVALAKEFNVPLLLELNAPLAVEQNAYRTTGLGELAARAEQWVLTQAQAVLAVSAGLREHALSLGAKPERVHVFPNGVDPARFQPGPREPAVRARWRLGEGPLIGFVGGLRPWHGVEILPALLERLARRHKKLRLVIVGEGQLRPELEQSVRERGLASRVLFTGGLSHEEVPSVIRHFDIALAPYPKLEHAFYFSPLKLFEYMACGLAVVAADVGQVSEVLRGGKTGLLYPPGDLDALTGVCDRLLNNRRLRMGLGRAASKMVHTHFTWDHNANRVEQLARDLIAARRPVTPSP